MALEFLSKKKWNPANTKNREQVWLREQALEKEKQKTAELQRQIQEERELMALHKAQYGESDEEFAKKRKVGWLYEVPIMDKRKSDDYLTGKATVDLDKEEKNQLRDLESKKVAGSLFLDGEDDVSNPNEILRRVNEDPLMQMRKREMELTRNRLSNSQKIMQIVDMLKERGSDISVDFSSVKKTDRSSGVVHLRKGLQRASSDSSDSSDSSESDSSDNYTAKLMRSADPASHRRSEAHVNHRRHRHGNRHRSRSRSRSRSYSRHHHHRHAHASHSSPRSSRRERSRRHSEMTSADVEARLRQMRDDAEAEEEDRKRRVEEEERSGREEKKEAPVFLAKMNSDVFGKGNMTLEGRVASRRFYSMKE